MSSHEEQPPLVLHPHFSMLLAGFVGITHLVAIGVVTMLPVGWPWSVGVGGLVLLSFLDQWTLHVHPLQPRALTEVVWEADGTWTLFRSSGETVTATLLPSTFVGVGLVVLNLGYGRFRVCSMVLLPDNLESGLLRRLRVRLRQQGTSDRSPPF